MKKQQPLMRTSTTSTAKPTTTIQHRQSHTINSATTTTTTIVADAASVCSGWPVLSTTEQLTIRDLARQAEEATRDVASWDMADDEDIVSTFYPEDSAQVVQHTLKELELMFGKKTSRFDKTVVNVEKGGGCGATTDSEAVSSIMRTLSHLVNTLIFAPTNTTRCSTYLSSYEQLLLENKKLVAKVENLKELLEVEECINSEIKTVLKIPSSSSCNNNTTADDDGGAATIHSADGGQYLDTTTNRSSPSASPSPRSNMLDRTQTTFSGDTTSRGGGGVLAQLATRRLEDRIKLLEHRFAESAAQNRVLQTKNAALQHALRQSLETMYGPDQGRAFAKLNYADLDPKEGEPSTTAIQEATSMAEAAILNDPSSSSSPAHNNSSGNGAGATTTLLGATEKLVFQSNAELAAILNMVAPRQQRKGDAAEAAAVNY